MCFEALPEDYTNTYSRYTALMNFIGIEFFTSVTSTAAKRRLFIFSVVTVPFIIGQFALIRDIRAENFLESVLVVPISAMYILDFIKITIALVKRSTFNQIFLETGKLWPRGLKQGDEKWIVMKKWNRKIRFSVDAFYIYALVTLTIYELTPLLLSCQNIRAGVPKYFLPFPVGLWEVNSTASFTATYVWELYSSIPVQLCLYLPYDLLVVTMTSNVSILLHFLQIDLENTMKYDSAQNGRRDFTDPDSCERFYRIVKDHQKLLRIAEQLNEVFGLVIFVHVAFSSIEICFFSFLAVVISGVAKTMVNIANVWYAIITVFLIASAGQLLCDTSTSVADAAYRCLWYQSDAKTKKIILFIIIRSQKPSYLSAMGFSDMTLRSFSKIMSSAWTYFSLLIQIYGEN